jgi:hypothetical protein
MAFEKQFVMVMLGTRYFINVGKIGATLSN